MTSERHQRRVNRWLVTDQKSAIEREDKITATERTGHYSERVPNDTQWL